MDGKIHTNGIENFWSLLKRALGGTYVSVVRQQDLLHRAFLDPVVSFASLGTRCGSRALDSMKTD